MSGVLTSELEGQEIRRNADDWFNLGDLARAGGKAGNFASQWVDGAGKGYIQLAESKVENSTLLFRKRGGSTVDRGIWAHYKIARRFAQAVSDEVAWHVDEIVEGKVSVGPPAEQSEAILIDCIRRLTDASIVQGSDITEIKEVQAKHGEAIQRIENSLTSHRKPFGKRATRAADACLDDKYNRGGKIVCPCCERPVVFVEYHHWQGKGGNSPTILFPIHPECHSEAEKNPEWHDRKRSEFNVFQKHAMQYFRAAGLMQNRQRSQVQPTFFGDIA